MAQTSPEKPSSDEKKLLEEAHARFKLCEDAESEIRRLSLEDIEFSLGEQWPEDIKRERDVDGRPCLVINKIAQHVNQITNDQRQNRPAIKVSPVDDKADIETAKVRQGLIRHIEYNSNADIAYSNGFEFAANGGFGSWRVVTDYVSPTSFKQEILIKQIKNAFSAYLDPNHKEPDGSDAEFGFVFEDIPKDAYKSKYPDSKLASVSEWESVGSQAPTWMPDGSARVAEYFYKEYKKDMLLLLSDGREILQSKVEGEIPEDAIVSKRETMIPTIKWCKINASEILEKTDFPGIYIPIIVCYGKDVSINGKRIVKGIVRDAKDPAKMYNFMSSAEAEAIALAPRAPFVLDPKQIEGYEGIWRDANRKNFAYLPHNMIVNGQIIPAPQRQSADVSTAAITNARMLASDDLKATTGIYDAALGAQSNETSGIAIQRRNVQAQTSNFHLIDNLHRSIRHTGRIINEMIPFVYDTAQTARILGEEGDERVVKINEPFIENGKEVTYAMDVGTYDVTIDTGPSFQTKRQEAAAAMLDLSKAAPQMMQIAPDLIIKNLDIPGAADIAERFKRSLPPGIADDKDKSKEIPPQVQAKIQSYEQLIDQLTGQLHSLKDERDQKLIEIESKERIEMAKLQNSAAIELAKLESKEATALLAHQMKEMSQRLDLLGINQPIENESQESQTQNSMAQSDGGYPAESSMESQPQPTGGYSPGQSMEGNQP